MRVRNYREMRQAPVIEEPGVSVRWLVNEMSEVLQELEERILEQARPQLQRLVEGDVGQESTLAEVHLDVANRSVLGFFQLG